jgi:hypothetical protein
LQTAASNDWFIGSSPLGTSTSDLSFYSFGTSSEVLKIAKSTGAATFSGNIGTGGVAMNTGWGTTYKGVDLNGGYGTLVGSANSTGFTGTGNGQTLWSQNTYYNGTSSIAIGTGAASQVLQGAGQFAFYTAPSVTAGSAQTFTEAIHINLSGTASTTTSTGTLLVTGGVGVSGQLSSNGIFSAGSIATGGVTITSGGTITANSTISGTKFIGASTTPSKVNGGATVIGSTGTVTLTGNDVAMRVAISVGGTSPSSVGAAVTITFANAYSSAPMVVLQNEVGTTAQRWDVANVTTTGFEIRPATVLTTGGYTVVAHVLQ